MSKKVYLGVDSKARNAKAAYIGIDGKARKVKKMYVGVGGVARECYAAGGDVPTALTWNINTKDSLAKINSTTNGGLTISAKAKSYISSTLLYSLYTNTLHLTAGTVITAELASYTTEGTTNKIAGINLFKSSTVKYAIYASSDLGSGSYTVAEDGDYFIGIQLFGVTGGQSGTFYYDATATYNISFDGG